MPTQVELERTLPHDLDAERAVLGAVLIHNGLLPQVVGAVGGVDFFRDAHRRIFESIVALDALGTPADMMTLRAELGRRGDLDEVGGPAYVAALIDGVPHASNVAHYAAIVREKARLRDLVYLANALATAAYKADERPSTLVERTVQRLSALSVGGRSGPTLVDDVVSAYLAGLDREGGLALPSGFVDVDALTGGFRLRDLTIVAARPSVGKSSLALGAANHIARAGHAVAYFSPEMSHEALAARLLAWRSGVPSDVLERRDATTEQWGATSAAMGDFVGVPLYLDDGSRSIVEVVAWCRRLKQQHDIKVVFIDYLQLLVLPHAGRSRQEDVALISATLKQQIAKDLDVAVVALSQLSRASDDRRDKRPHLSDLRESGALEQDADVAILLFREEMHRPKPENAGIAEAIVAKQRNGPTGVVRLAFLQRLARFDNLAQEYGS